ncbi:unnamed protein product [Meganyctiphanes norvegica]|uniref:CN hydrolase domain-containing protein n=1 Tax=Meganyctiphanes norvegica TaxID=48144 RepID=A0AAV2R8H7_MEGNR
MRIYQSPKSSYFIMQLQSTSLPVIIINLIFVVHNLAGSDLLCDAYANEECDNSTAKEEIEYVAAVLEYAPSIEGNATQRLRTNAEVFAEYAAQAKEQNADILVFPEYGLTETSVADSTDHLLPFSLIVPDPSQYTVPCDYPPDQPYSQALSMLSCTAADLSLYLVVDLPEQVDCSSAGCPDDYYFYNTMVVFDRQGAVVARYRKQHLFLEPGYTPGNEDPETAIFTTDFGVTFSLQNYFDVMYDSPGVLNVVNHGIKDVIMSTAWVDELPHFTAPQHFSGWSVGLGVNFLVSGLHQPTSGQLGSGIFFGVTGDDPLYVWNATLGDELLVHRVTTYKSEASDLLEEIETTESTTINITYKPSDYFEKEVEQLNPNDQLILHEDLSNYTNVVLKKSELDIILTQTSCHNELICCTVTYTWPNNDTKDGNYLLLAFSGNYTIANTYTMYTETCSVVYCLSPDIDNCTLVENMVPSHNSFKVLSLDGSFNTEYVYPSVMTQDMHLYNRTLWTFVELDYNKEKYPHSIRFESDEAVSNLLSLTMFGRWFEKDVN